MNRVEIRALGGLIRYKRDVPSEYSEITGKQFYNYMAHYNGKISFNRFLARFYNVPYPIIFLMGSYLRFRITELLEFLTTLTISIDGFFLEKIPGTILMSPSEKLSDMSFLQFMYADRIFTDYVNTEDPELLYHFTAAIYKPDDILFSDLNMEENLITVKKYATDVFCQATLLNFVMIRTWLSSNYPFMFPVAEEKEKPHRKGRNNWLDIFDAFVGDNIPDTEYYENMSCMNAFRIINKRIKEHQNASRKL